MLIEMYLKNQCLKNVNQLVVRAVFLMRRVESMLKNLEFKKN